MEIVNRETGIGGRDTSIQTTGVTENWERVRVNVPHLLDDFLDMYPYGPVECLVVETIANSLDAGAGLIDVSTDPQEGIYRAEDWGKGMNRSEFEDYPVIALSARQKGRGIGFAGIGSKLYWGLCERTVTKTRSNGFCGCIEVRPINGIPQYRFISSQPLPHNGTLVEVEVRKEDFSEPTPKNITSIIQRHYNTILFGMYDGKEIRMNGHKVPPITPEAYGIETKKVSQLKVAGGHVWCFLYLAKHELPVDLQGLTVVVFGKSIMKNQWFALENSIASKYYPKIGGYVLADFLAPLLTTDKLNFQATKNPWLWSSFKREVYRHFRGWLESIGAMERVHAHEELFPELDPIARDLERELNKLFNDPEFTSMNLFQGLTRRDVAIRQSGGNVPIGLANGKQLTIGAFDSDKSGEGKGARVEGPDIGSSPTSSSEGKDTGVLHSRRVRSGIRINYATKPEIDREAWFTPEAIVINTAHPAFHKCSVYGPGAERVHIVRCIFDVAIEQRLPEDSGEVLKLQRRLFSKWGQI